MTELHQLERRIQDSLAFDYDLQFQGLCWRRYRESAAAKIADSLPGDTKARLLDIGCGTGEVLRLVAGKRANTTLVGADISERMIEITAGKVPAVLAVCSVFENLPFADETFDVVAANSVLHHLPDLKAAAREVHRILRPGGRFLAFEPNSDCFVWSRRIGGRIARLILKPLRSFVKRRNRTILSAIPPDPPQSPVHRNLTAGELLGGFSGSFCCQVTTTFPIIPLFECCLLDNKLDRRVLRMLSLLDRALTPVATGGILVLHAEKRKGP